MHAGRRINNLFLKIFLVTLYYYFWSKEKVRCFYGYWNEILKRIVKLERKYNLHSLLLKLILTAFLIKF